MPVDIGNAKARLQDSQTAVESARNNLANIDIRSPISGTVYNIPFSQYDFVPFGDDMVDVADLTHLQVRALFRRTGDRPACARPAGGDCLGRQTRQDLARSRSDYADHDLRLRHPQCGNLHSSRSMTRLRT